MNNKRLLGLVCLLLSAAGALAAHWTVNPYDYRYDMTVYAVLQTGGTAVDDYTDYEVAAFNGNECRGIGKVQTATDGTKYLYMRIYSNAATSEQISFRAYQASEGKEHRLKETILFEADAMEGTPSEPMALTLSSILQGDVNGDGEVDLSDAIMVTYYALRVIPANFIEAAADLNGDGDIDLSDAIIIIYKSLGVLESRREAMPVEEAEIHEPD